MIFSWKRCVYPRGFTLVELIVVVAIILIIAALAFPNYNSILNRADQIVCTSKLRTLWTDFSSRLNDGQGWPQLPDDVQMGTTAEQQWWISSTSNTMGLTLNDWRCPSYFRALQNATNSSQQPYLISYLPTLFDSNPLTPKKWGRMPWFTEIAGSHGGVGLSIRADGSVCPSTNQ